MPQKPKPTKKHPRWHEDVDEASAARAFKYLTLFMDDELALFVTNQLCEQQNTLTIRVRDLLRAAELPLLERTDAHVAREFISIDEGVKLSPILCLQGDRKRRPLIADGYYRACAAYHRDADAEVPVKVV